MAIVSLSHIIPLVTEFKQCLQAVYGDQLADLILFGSYARGDFDRVLK